MKTLDVLDFLEVAEYPKIKQAVEATTPDKESVINTLNVIENTILKDPKLSHNSLVRAIVSGAVRLNQAIQCVGIRGFPTNVDGHVYPHPILSNYINGMKTPYEVLAESRAAAKHYVYSQDPLKKSAYSSRRTEFILMSVEKIYRCDCGSQQYMNWYVRPPSIVNGIMTRKGDLDYIMGMYYYDKEGGRLRVIGLNDHHLYNQVIPLRMPFYCQHPDPKGICEVCFGTLAENIADHQNLGHISSTSFMKKIIQTMLSIKHYVASGEAQNISLGEMGRKIFSVKNRYIYIKPEMLSRGKQLVLSIDHKSAPGLNNITMVDQITTLHPKRITSISEVTGSYTDSRGKAPFSVILSQKGVHAHMTPEFLEYLMTHPWNSYPDETFAFDMSHEDWDTSKPIFFLPDTEYDYIRHSKEITGLIEGTMKNISKRTAPGMAESILTQLYEIVTSKLDVSLSILGLVVYANMVRNPSKDLGGLSRGSKNAGVGVFSNTISQRSLGALLSYQEHFKNLTDPRTFFLLDQPDSPLDVCIDPAAVIDYYYGTKKK